MYNYHPEFESVVALTKGATSDPDGYVRLYKSNHPQLFINLTRLGFFDFNTSNDGSWVVGAHAVVAFMSYGWKALSKGITISKDTHQVHHLNNNPRDNNPNNLVYLTLQSHKIVSNVSKTNFVGSLSDDDMASLEFNRQGRLISSYQHWLTNAIADTLTAIKEGFVQPIDTITKLIYKVILPLVPAWIKQVLQKSKLIITRSLDLLFPCPDLDNF